jgi:Ribbon-helix-helix protein, copG family
VQDSRGRPAISADIISVVPDVLIRDVPAEDLARIDAHAARMGISRTELLRRRIRQEAARPAAPVTADDLRRFGSRFSDLGDAEVMRGAWS